MLEEYRKSLKMAEAEEVLDLIFFRPIAYGFVRLIYRLPITPNQVTLLSLAAGLAAARYFSVGTSIAFIWAACWYAFANILDCSDGQLARVQQSGTLLGRVVDGVADYISSVAIFLGIGIGLAASGSSSWFIVVLAGLSSATHAMFFDHYQSEFIAAARMEQNFIGRELDQFTAEIQRLKLQRQGRMRVVVLALYIKYLRLQWRSSTQNHKVSIDPDLYQSENKSMIRLWSFLGPTTNRSLLIMCATMGRLDVYLWTIIVAGNLWLCLCYVLQGKIHRRSGDGEPSEGSLGHGHSGNLRKV